MSTLERDRQQFALAMQASPDLMDRFDRYAELLCHWQARINLVGPQTLGDIWRRHFLDSAQVWQYLPDRAETLIDIGSGAGFPGLVLALLLRERGGPQVTLVESDQRKAVFLREANRLTNAGVEVRDVRIETLKGFGADVVTARACAPLKRLFPWVSRVIDPAGTALLLKGAAWRDELTVAEKEWKMRMVEFPSITDASGVILKLEGLAKIG